MDTTATPADGLRIQRLQLEELHPDPANARRHGDENMAAIEASLRRFGQAEPLVVHAATKRVIGGNGRLAAMKRLGWTECDVVEMDVGDVDAAALGIALNRTAELAEWDDEALTSLLRGLKAEESMDGVGFDEAALDKLLADLEGGAEAEVEDPGPGEVPAEPVTRLGDLWTLGDHRLFCGDSTEDASFATVLLTEKADILWTDPPYGVSYVGKTADELTIENDELVGQGLEEFLGNALYLAAAGCKPGAVWYVAAPAGPNFLPFASVLTDLGVWRQTLVWAKNAFVLGRSDFHYKHEAIFYGWTPGAAHHAPPTRDLDTIWECPRPAASPDHPTTKPTELVTRALEYSSDKGDVVLDPFCGSGTTILAAEATGRRARGIELSPGYCDVIIRRWQEATGKQATLDGRPFDEVRDERLA